MRTLTLSVVCATTLSTAIVGAWFSMSRFSSVIQELATRDLDAIEWLIRENRYEITQGNSSNLLSGFEKLLNRTDIIAIEIFDHVTSQRKTLNRGFRGWSLDADESKSVSFPEYCQPVSTFSLMRFIVHPCLIFSGVDTFDLLRTQPLVSFRWISGEQSPRKFRNDLIASSVAFLLIGILLAISAVWAIRLLFVQRIDALLRLVDAGSLESLSKLPLAPNSIYIIDIFKLEVAIKQLATKLLDAEDQLEIQTRSMAFFDLAGQVAHDIRSPLAALDAIGNDLKLLPEDTRVLVRHAIARIRDIANNLVTQYRDLSKPLPEHALGSVPLQSAPESTSVFSAEPKSTQLLSSILDSIVSEKRAQLRSRLGVILDFALTVDGYGIFSEVPLTEFKRVLSNLINNAAEAIESTGHVTVSLRNDGKTASILIQDTGKGIALDVLTKLGERGYTVGKSGGTGLGLNHAMESVRSWGGDVRIESIVGHGTTVTLSLQQTDSPRWFVPELEIVAGARVVILDDDASIHQIWNGRLDSVGVAHSGVEVSHFSRSQDLIDWLTSEEGKREHERPRVFLLDYELIGDPHTGLDVAEKLGISDESILITSRYEENSVRARCEKLGVPLIPKGMAGFVPIRISGEQRLTLDAVLIDDDLLVHQTWKRTALAKNKNIVTHTSVDEFIGAKPRVHSATPIYIDSQLAHGLRGETEALKLQALGYKRLYLATGRDPSEFKNQPHIIGVVGKSPPWA